MTGLSRRSVIATQPSLFSADLAVPDVADLGGLLAANGQIVRHPDSGTTRLSVLLPDDRRAAPLRAEFTVRALDVEVLPAEDGRVLLRAVPTSALNPLAQAWTKGAIKAVPTRLEVAAGFLRCWVLAAGTRDDAGFRLGLDPHAPDTHDALLGALGRAGLAGSYLGVRGGGPAVRIVGHRRLARLTELLGTIPDGLPVHWWPDPQA